MLDPQVIAKAVGAPVANVEATWPVLYECLKSLGMPGDLTAVAAIATAAAETGPKFTDKFMPVRELGNAKYFTTHYWENENVRKNLGNRTIRDAIRFCGRGLIQITGYANYLEYGRLLGVDLITNPDTALTIDGASAIFAGYFLKHKVFEAAEARDWERVRRLVNGGLNGYAEFKADVDRLLAFLPTAATA
jgi:predicted chitinase